MVDALFGSKTRVKLLHLFMNNPNKAFYVREITRLIDEQINSVRRELSNMLEVGVITSDNADNKLYYEVNQQYEHYTPLRAMFADQKVVVATASTETATPVQKRIRALTGVRVAVIAGVLVKGSASSVDLLLVGDLLRSQVSRLVTALESAEGRELTYSVLSYDEFYYRLSVRDRFISDLFANKHQIVVDVDNVIK